MNVLADVRERARKIADSNASLDVQMLAMLVDSLVGVVELQRDRIEGFNGLLDNLDARARNESRMRELLDTRIQLREIVGGGSR